MERKPQKNRKKAVKYPYFLSEILLAVAPAVLLFSFGSGGYTDIQDVKNRVFLLLFGGYLLLMLLFTLEMLLLRTIKLCSPGELWRQSSAVQRLVALFWAASVLSALVSPHFPQTLLGMSRNEGLLTVTVYCGCFLCLSVYGRIKEYMLWVAGGAMSVFAVICLLQLRGLNPLGLFPEGYNYFDADIAYTGSYLGTTGNAGITAALLCLAFPVFWVLLLRLKGKTRLLLLIPAALCLAVLVQMRVEAGWAAVLVGTPVTCAAVIPMKAGRRKWLWAGVAALFAAGLAWVFFGSHSGSLLELQQVLRGNWDPSFGSYRADIWQKVLAKIPERLLLGAGPDTMLAAGIAVGVSPVDAAHNEYLNVLYHQGLLGLLCYGSALVVSAVGWLRRSPGNFRAAALGAGVLGYCIQACFSISMCQSAGLFWIVWALLERAGRNEEVLL